MARFDAQKLYDLLPTVYRLRDAERKEPLKELLEVIAGQVAVVENDIEQLYDNLFVETCDEWVVPYIAELLGLGGLHDIPMGGFSQRARVANTLTHRRRKGTAAMLEQLARDTTGWPARVVEYFELLGTTQHLNHVRLQNARTLELRRQDGIGDLGTPFETAAHTAEVRRIAVERGRYNIRNIGIFLWRLRAYPLERVVASSPAAGQFRFSPLGNDSNLYNGDATRPQVTELAVEYEVPAPLRRRALHDELELRRQAIADGEPLAPHYFDEKLPVWRIYQDDQTSPVPSEETLICDLSDWHDPPTSKSYQRGDGTSVALPIRAAVDPVLGRIVFPSAVAPPSRVEVDYHYGFAADVGAGPYRRTLEVPEGLFVYDVGRSQAFDTVAGALAQWEMDGKPSAVVRIADSRSYDEGLGLSLPAGVSLELRAVSGQRPLLQLQRPLTIEAAPPASADEPRAGVIVDGLLVAGHPIEVVDGDLGFLHLRRSTLVPGLALNADGSAASPDQASLRIVAGNARVAVNLESSISGALALGPTGRLEVRDSIVDGLDVPLAIEGPVVVVERSTVFGSVAVVAVELASNSLFTHALVVERKQQGCVRFCYLPPASVVPRQHRCQPRQAVRVAIESALEESPALSNAKQNDLAASVRQRVQPVFTARDYSEPAYAQLHELTADEIRRGADDEAELGVFNHLKQPQREANFRTSLDEYLRVGLEAGVYYVT